MTTFVGYVTMFGVVLFSVLQIVPYSYGYTVTTQGSGTVQCGNKTCAPEAACVNDTCSCSIAPYIYGNGGLTCYTAIQYSTFVANDPILYAFTRVRANLALPCRYQLASFSSNFLLNGNINGQCLFTLRPFHGKDKGKFYPKGYDLAVRVYHLDSTLWQYSVRKEGIAVSGQYIYQINATADEYNVDGEFGDDQVNLVHNGFTLVDCHVDQTENMAVVDIPYCGVLIRFRAYDLVDRRNQKFTPGIMVTINEENGPFFSSSDDLSLGLSPTGTFNQNVLDSALVNSSKNAAVTDRFLTTAKEIPQNITSDPNEACHTAADSYNNCSTSDDKLLAFNNCLWMFTTPLFINCFDKSTSGYFITDLFAKCVAGFCEPDCAPLKAALDAADCGSYGPVQSTITACLNHES